MRRMVQIFVKVDELKNVAMEVSPEDKSPEDPEHCEWKRLGCVRDVRRKDHFETGAQCT